MNRHFGRGWMLAGMLVITAGSAGIAGAGWAQDGKALHGMHGHGSGAAIDPAVMDAHFDKMFAEILPDGTAEQKTRLKVVAKSVHADLGALHAQFRPAHQRAHALLLQSAVDRAGLEVLRVEQVRQVDLASKHIFQALGDAAEVLTPAQRVQLFAHLKAHGEKGAAG